MPTLYRPMILISLLSCGALFGFFYAWVCSTMWGLDAADPRVAIAAMQAMNASVRNAVFAPAFFGTPVIMLLTAALLWGANQRAAASWFGAATLAVTLLGVVLTMMINVPMNEALALVQVPQEQDAAQAVWTEYSVKWQFWNQIRTIATGSGLLMAGIGTLALTRG